MSYLTEKLNKLRSFDMQ